VGVRIDEGFFTHQPNKLNNPSLQIM